MIARIPNEILSTESDLDFCFHQKKEARARSVDHRRRFNDPLEEHSSVPASPLDAVGRCLILLVEAIREPHFRVYGDALVRVGTLPALRW
jgi:hypothetical protein